MITRVSLSLILIVGFSNLQTPMILPNLAAQTSSDSIPEETESDSRQTPNRIDVEFSDGKTKPFFFLQFLPTQYEADGEALPLLIFLHGRGECGNDLDRVKVWGPPKLVENQEDFPFVVISPQCPEPGWDVSAIKGLLDHATKSLNVDTQRIYITGLSMGGYGTWKFAAEFPDLIAAAIPICGGGHPAKAKDLVDVPIWAFHGDADSVVPVTQSQNMVQAIKDIDGSNVKLTIYEGVQHNSWQQTYANPEIYEWLLSHRRTVSSDD